MRHPVLLLCAVLGLTGRLGADVRAEHPQERIILFGTAHRVIPRGQPATFPDSQAYSQDLVDIVAGDAGLKYRIVEFDRWSAMEAAFRRGDVDVLTTVARIPERKGRMLFTVPHVRGGLVATVRASGFLPASLGQIRPLRIAAVADSYDVTYLRRNALIDHLILVDDIKEVLRAVADGRADVGVSNEFTALSARHELGMDGSLRVAFTLPDSLVDFCMAVRPGDDVLLGELNDGLFLAQQSGQLQSNYEHWFRTFELSGGRPGEMLRWIGLSIGGAFLAVLAAWALHRHSLRKARARTAQVEAVVGMRTRELATAVQRLRQSEELFQRAFRMNPSAVGILDYERRIFVDVNDQYLRLFGYTREECIGRTPVELGLWGEIGQRSEYNRALRDCGSVRDMEVEAVAKDGSRLHCLLSAEVADFGSRRCLVSCLVDITGRRRAAQEQERLRTQLQQSRRLEALGTLAGGIAHDFNNILTAILANRDLAELELHHDPVLAQGFLDEVKKAGHRARDLVRRILAFSRQQPQEVAPLSLSVLLEEVLALLRSSIPRSVEIVTHLDPEVPMIMGDSGQLHQVVMNLCTNAAHAMREKGGRLSVGCEGVRVDAALAAAHPGLVVGAYARFTVADTGHGMDPDTLQRVFEPFFTTKAPGEGTGLGLAVVHGIIQEHKGAIVADSTQGTGTCFTVYIPVAGNPAGLV